jgi:hypothetical protein
MTVIARSFGVDLASDYVREFRVAAMSPEDRRLHRVKEGSAD